jgi:hypothetical protein
MRAVLTAMLLFLAAAAPASSRDYESGQVWKYHARAGDPSSLLRIDSIEYPDAKSGEPVYHISVIGVHLGMAGKSASIDHLPVSQTSLDASVTELTRSTASFPDPTKDIDHWRVGHGGVHTIPVAEIVEMTDRTERVAASGLKPR